MTPAIITTSEAQFSMNSGVAGMSTAIDVFVLPLPDWANTTPGRANRQNKSFHMVSLLLAVDAKVDVHVTR
jgi:hypothetical protein